MFKIKFYKVASILQYPFRFQFYRHFYRNNTENLVYLLDLLKKADHKINREEIKDYRTALKLELY